MYGVRSAEPLHIQLQDLWYCAVTRTKITAFVASYFCVCVQVTVIDLFIQRSDDVGFSFKKIGPGQVFASNGMMCNEVAVVIQIFNERFQFDEQFFFRRRRKLSIGCLL